jgi:hypothetical protein
MTPGRCGNLTPKILIIFLETPMQDDQERKARIKHWLTRLTITRVRALYRLFFPMGNTNRSREELAAMVLKFLYFENQEKFDEWFNARTKAEQAIIKKLAFYKAYPVTSLEDETDTDLMSTKKEFYSVVVKVNPDFKLFPLEFRLSHEVFILTMPEVLQIACMPFLKPPVYHDNDAYNERDKDGNFSGETAVFNNSNNFFGMFALFYESIASPGSLLHEFPYQNPLKLAKKVLTAFYRESGFPRFPACDFPTPDSLSLAAAFILCQNHGKLPPEGVSIRGMVHRFFFLDPDMFPDYYYFAGSYFESILTGAYMKRRGPPEFDSLHDRPVTRQIFFDFLKSIENRDSPVSMDELFTHVLANGVFRFSSTDVSRFFRLKASSVTVDGTVYRSKENEIVPEYSLFFELVTKPLFRAYCFVFCALGCLEVTVAKPQYNAELDGKEKPVSLYDGVRAIHLTEFGKWCLGFTEQMPKEDSQEFEITADPALLYVTLRGKSLERRVFLDKIGVKIGEERWTVNAASFASGCTQTGEITERIKKFYVLVDEHPAEHWEIFFNQIEKNAGAIKERTDDFLVYHIDMDRETRAELMSDAEFRRVARFAEDDLVLVLRSNRQKFLSILASRGIGALATPHSQDSSPY